MTVKKCGICDQLEPAAIAAEKKKKKKKKLFNCGVITLQKKKGERITKSGPKKPFKFVRHKFLGKL